MKKRIAAIIMAIGLSVSITGCGSIIELPTKQSGGTLVSYDKTGVTSGYYIKDANDMYYPLYTNGKTFQGKTDYAKADRIIWNPQENDTAIPTLTKDSLLVYFSKENRLHEVTLERFQDIGYTIGCRNIIYDEEEQYAQLSLRGSNIKEASSLATYTNQLETGSIVITAINEEPFQQGYLTEAGTIQGLEANKLYKLTIYAGTNAADIEVVADTHALMSKAVYKIEDIDDTRENYAILHLPEGLPTGYYLLDGKGLFRYESDVPEDSEYEVPKPEEVKATEKGNATEKEEKATKKKKASKKPTKDTTEQPDEGQS